MTKLLVIADDFTGALDTGVQFASRGADTRVMTDAAIDLRRVREDASVLVVNAGTRHLPAEKAYNAVFAIVDQAVKEKIPYVYKKTDSGLRGNIGAELSAAMDAAGVDRMAFIPAFPQMDRVTRRGIHYINGTPVAQSVFGSDPFEPVRCSDVGKIVGAQTDKSVMLCTRSYIPEGTGIQIFDAEADADLEEIADRLGDPGLYLSAGCAGFASVLADRLGLRGEKPRCTRKMNSLLLVCGSLNPVTMRQMDLAEQAGYPRIRLTPAQKLDLGWLDTEPGQRELRRWAALAEEGLCIVDVNGLETGATDRYGAEHGIPGEEVRFRIAGNLGELIRRLLDQGLRSTLMCTGGDTLLAVMRSLGVLELTPFEELAPGVVLTSFMYKGREHEIISKSGGFGDPDLLCMLAERKNGMAVPSE